MSGSAMGLGDGLEDIIGRIGENVEIVIRSPGMQKLLERLQQEDRLFDYNVPPNIRENYGDGSLLQYLKETYSQQNFVVENAADVQKYLLWGDRVMKKGDFEKVNPRLPQGTRGVVENLKGGNDGTLPAGVNFFNYGRHEVYPSALLIYGKKGGWLRKDEQYAFPIKPEEIMGGLQKGHLVEYTGKDFKEYEYLVPNGTLGIVNTIWSGLFAENPLDIIWARGPGVRQIGYIYRDTRSSRSKIFFSYDEVKLVVPNHINFQKLMDECKANETAGAFVIEEVVP